MTAKKGIFDLQGLTIGVILCALGILFLKSSGLVTGQAAGLALLLSYVLPWDFGATFFAVSAPFLLIAYRRRGPVFTSRTLIVVVGISFAVEALGHVVLISDPGRPLAALLGGILIGIGVLSVFRHNASAGGMSILSLIVEERTGIKAGWVQLGIDALVFFAACFVLAPGQVFYSSIAAALMNLIIIWNFDIRQARSGGPLVEDSAGS